MFDYNKVGLIDFKTFRQMYLECQMDHKLVVPQQMVDDLHAQWGNAAGAHVWSDEDLIWADNTLDVEIKWSPAKLLVDEFGPCTIKFYQNDNAPNDTFRFSMGHQQQIKRDEDGLIVDVKTIKNLIVIKMFGEAYTIFLKPEGATQ